ncbi:uncharacterized protein LOC119665793 [Teleopsis dalmanni]|uniref:uncharacterized protein LOC119665785 n=1 Tax=Teleopsis dalmanni TaxID=139649 RepID=UPI0018CE892F|nr:uncharacterized protein LOC119665785 [Teleopsis dalmanni]XP_037930968.1 uncharacterized protein LOC119665793 [Teleopsis dalmanni]
MMDINQINDPTSSKAIIHSHLINHQETSSHKRHIPDSSHHQNKEDKEDDIITIYDSDSSMFELPDTTLTSYHPINATRPNTSLPSPKRQKPNIAIDVQSRILNESTTKLTSRTQIMKPNSSNNSTTLSNLFDTIEEQVSKPTNPPILPSTNVVKNKVSILPTSKNTNNAQAQANDPMPPTNSNFPLNILEPFIESNKNSPKPNLYAGIMPLTEYNIQLYPKIVPGGFTNMTTYYVPLEVETILSFGPKYCPIRVPVIYDYYNVVKNYYEAHLDSFINLNLCNPLEMEAHYTQVLNIIEKEQNLTSVQQSLKQLYEYAANYLKKHKDTLIVQSDKCKSTVLMYRSDYIEKMTNWISSYIGTGSCVEVCEDPGILSRRIGGYFRKVARPLCRLYEKNNTLYSKEIYQEIQKLLSGIPTLPYLYGTIKTHKDDASIRPICSPLGWYISPIHKLVQCLLKYTIEDRLSSHNVYNINHLTGHILGLRPISNYVLISIDIKEMYPSTQILPLLQTLNNIMQLSWFLEKCPIPISLLEQSIQFILLHGNYFTFNGKLYQQIEGLPQGGSASGLLATIYIDSKLELYAKTIMTTYRVHAWWKYVDDVLVYLPRTNVDSYCTALSKLIGYKLTYEVETPHPLYHNHPCISYLDYRIIHTEDSFKLALYKKPKLSNRTCHYTSHVPHHIKKATLSYYLKRIVYRTSVEYLQRDITECVDQLLQNSYPLLLIIHTLKAIILGYPCISSPYIQHSTPARMHLLKQFIKPYELHSEPSYPYLTHITPKPKQYNKSIVFSCEEISFFLRSSLKDLSVGSPTFCRSDTLFTLLHMSLRSIGPTKHLSSKHRILLTTCKTCDIGFLCTGKGIPREIIEDVLKDTRSPMHQHSVKYNHLISTHPVELPYSSKLQPSEQMQLYKTIYVSMGLEWDPNQNYELIPRFIARSLDAYLQRFRPILPLNNTKTRNTGMKIPRANK